jgi:hypothetical protein
MNASKLIELGGNEKLQGQKASCRNPILNKV